MVKCLMALCADVFMSPTLLMEMKPCAETHSYWNGAAIDFHWGLQCLHETYKLFFQTIPFSALSLVH